MAWTEVVERIIREQKRSPFIVRQDDLSALQITNIIMREENLMIGLANNDIFLAHLPEWLPVRIFFSKSVIFTIRNIIYKKFYDRKSKINLGAVKPEYLCNTFRFAGIFALVGLGPMCIFVFMYFFMRHCEDFRSHRNSPLERQWTGYAEWNLREYNELSHTFKKRLESCKSSANMIVDRNEIVANTPLTDALRKIIKYVSGSLLAVLVVLACIDDTPLLFLKIGGKNLLWYLAVLTFVVTIADTSQIKKKSTINTLATDTDTPGNTMRFMETTVYEFSKCTHYMPTAWKRHIFLTLNNRTSFDKPIGMNKKHLVVDAFGIIVIVTLL